MLIPDESVIPTLARISKYKKVGHTWLVEQNNIVGDGNQFQNFEMSKHECRGSLRRKTCVFSLLDLPTILSSGKIVGKIQLALMFATIS